MEKIDFLIGESSQYLQNTEMYLKEHSLGIALIFFIILFCVYFYLYLREWEKNKQIAVEYEVFKQGLELKKKEHEKELENIKKGFEFDKNKLQKMCDDLSENMKQYLRDISEIKTHYANITNKHTTQIAYYKKRYLSLELSIRENFGKNKAVLNLIKGDFKDFMKKKTKELIELHEKK